MKVGLEWQFNRIILYLLYWQSCMDVGSSPRCFTFNPPHCLWTERAVEDGSSPWFSPPTWETQQFLAPDFASAQLLPLGPLGEWTMDGTPLSLFLSFSPFPCKSAFQIINSFLKERMWLLKESLIDTYWITNSGIRELWLEHRVSISQFRASLQPLKSWKSLLFPVKMINDLL